MDYFFDATGAMRLVRCSVALRAKSSGVRLYYAGHSYPADQRPGVLSVHVESGARIEEVRESESGSLQTFFALDRPISPADSDPYELIFTVAVHSSVVSIPRLRYHAVQGNQRMTLRAQFQPPALPDQNLVVRGAQRGRCRTPTARKRPEPGRDQRVQPRL